MTEGILKAEIAHQVSGKTFLGNPGIGNWRDLYEVLQVLKNVDFPMWKRYMTWISSLGLSATKSIVKSVRSVKIGRKKGIQNFECPKKKIETGYYTKRL